jgi:hypothetical protein
VAEVEVVVAFPRFPIELVTGERKKKNFFFCLLSCVTMGDKAVDDEAERSKGAGQQVVVHACR